MKKVISLSLFLGFLGIAYGINFYGHQSIVNLGAHQLFTAPASGSYFINGMLTLPHTVGNSGSANSEVVAQVSKNGATVLYTGTPGANGFSIPAVSLVSRDSIAVSVTSTATVDQGFNKIKGDVFFGNAN